MTFKSIFEDKKRTRFVSGFIEAIVGKCLRACEHYLQLRLVHIAGFAAAVGPSCCARTRMLCRVCDVRCCSLPLTEERRERWSAYVLAAITRSRGNLMSEASLRGGAAIEGRSSHSTIAVDGRRVGAQCVGCWQLHLHRRICTDFCFSCSIIFPFLIPHPPVRLAPPSLRVHVCPSQQQVRVAVA